MIHVLLYIVTAIVFLALDVVMLKKVMYPLFSSTIGPMMLEVLRMGPAAVFYLFYVVGVVWFVSIPALNVGSIAQAFFAGAVLGALAYGTYEFTNFATLKGWTAQMVTVDVIWGAVLTGTSAAVGVAVTKYFT